MVDAEPKLARRYAGLGFNVFWMRFVNPSWAVALYV
jgi:hypothetical protein